MRFDECSSARYRGDSSEALVQSFKLSIGLHNHPSRMLIGGRLNLDEILPSWLRPELTLLVANIVMNSDTGIVQSEWGNRSTNLLLVLWLILSWRDKLVKVGESLVWWLRACRMLELVSPLTRQRRVPVRSVKLTRSAGDAVPR